jgi:ATP-dependent Clp protease ATP-binding subunit ClpB
MEDHLQERVVEQPEAVRLVRRHPPCACRSADLTGYGSFLFLGPTGVGDRVQGARGVLFDSDHLIRIGMSEFMEKHAGRRLIGAAWPVGHEGGGLPLKRGRSLS